MKKKVMRVLAFALTLSMLFTVMTGCGKSEQAKKVVFSVGDTQVTLDEVWFYCKSVQEYYESYYSSMFSSPEVWTSSYPVEKDDGSTEESTLENIAKRSAIKQIRQIKVAVNQANKKGIKLSDSEEKQVVSQAKDFMAKVTKDEQKKMGINRELAENVFRESALVEKLKSKLATDAGIEISDEEAKTSKIYYIYFPTAAKDASGNAVSADEKNMKQAQKDAEDALERVQAGNDIASVAAAYGMGGNSGEMTIDTQSQLPEQVSKAVANLKDGETYDKVIATSDGLYIIQMISNLDETATQQKKQQLLSEKEQELLDKKFKTWTKGTDFDYDKDVDWDYMKEIDFVATSSVTQSKSSQTTAAANDTTAADTTTAANDTTAADTTTAASDTTEKNN